MILEYKLNIDFDKVLRTPAWITSGGFLPNADNDTLIGFTSADHPFYLPDTVVTYTVDGLKERSLLIHDVTPYHNEDGSVMTDAEVEAMVQAIIDANDIA